jgi:hypothetical protein
VAVTQLDNLSFAAMTEQFEHLPATSQAALVMAGMAAFIIPIGTLVAGEGLAAIVLERRLGVDYRELRWREMEFTLVYRAVFVHYLKCGLPDGEAKLRAFSEVKGYLAKGSTPSVRMLSAPNGQSEQAANGQPKAGVKAKVSTYLADHPEAAQMSVNQLLSVLNEQGVRAGRTTVAEVLKEAKVKRTA